MGWGHLKIFFSRFTGPVLTRLGTNHPWRERIQLSLKEGDSSSPRGDNSERVKIHQFFFKKNLLLQNQQAKINQTWNKLSFGEENSSLFKYRARSISKGGNHRNVRKGWGHLKILFLRTMKPEKLNFT
jgi:hypothetical protein